jgi:hemerythrin-like domain-containing protein
LTQHRRLEQDAENLRRLRKSVDPDPQTLADAGKRLEAHIRWEERELFDRVQQQLDDKAIEQLQHKTAAIEAARPRNTCREPRTGSA